MDRDRARPSFDERRHSQRIDVSGNAVVHGPVSVMRCEIVDLSTGGALLRPVGNGAAAPLPGVGVTVDLHLDAADTGWFTLRAVVHRSGVAGGAFAVEFGDVTAEFEDLVEDEVLAALEAARILRVIVVDPIDRRRQRLATELRRAGCSPFEVSTPLDAIGLIDQSQMHFSFALVAEQLLNTEGRDLMGFLAVTHPQVHLALIADRPPGATGNRALLHVDGTADLGGQVQRLLREHHAAAWTTR